MGLKAPLPLFARAELNLPPDFDADVASLNLLLREPMAHVGLEDNDIFVELFDGEHKLRGLDDEVNTRPLHNPVMWFVECTHGLAIFGADATAGEDVDALLHDLAHAVFRAYCAIREVSCNDDTAGISALGLEGLLGGFAGQE